MTSIWFPNNKYPPNTKNYLPCFVLGGGFSIRRKGLLYQTKKNQCSFFLNLSNDSTGRQSNIEDPGLETLGRDQGDRIGDRTAPQRMTCDMVVGFLEGEPRKEKWAGHQLQATWYNKCEGKEDKNIKG